MPLIDTFNIRACQIYDTCGIHHHGTHFLSGRANSGGWRSIHDKMTVVVSYRLCVLLWMGKNVLCQRDKQERERMNDRRKLVRYEEPNYYAQFMFMYIHITWDVLHFHALQWIRIPIRHRFQWTPTPSRSPVSTDSSFSSQTLSIIISLSLNRFHSLSLLLRKNHQHHRHRHRSHNQHRHRGKKRNEHNKHWRMTSQHMLTA